MVPVEAKRIRFLHQVGTALGRSRVVALIGPRQRGETTLVRCLLDPDSVNYFDSEDPAAATESNANVGTPPG